MRSILQRLLVLVCFLYVLVPSSSRADDGMGLPSTVQAREHLKSGNRFYIRARWDDALREYKAGKTIEDVPVFDYNIGQALRMSGAYEDSLLYYERFLDRGQPDDEVRAAVEHFIAEMRAQLANRARTMPPTEPATAPIAAAVPIPTPRNVADRHVGAGAASENNASEGPTQSDREQPTRWLGWTTASIGVAAIGVSGYLFLSASSMNADSDSEPDRNKRADLRDGARTRNLIGVVTGASGLALTATGIVLLVTQHRENARRDTPRVSFGVTPRGVLVSGRF